MNKINKVTPVDITVFNGTGKGKSPHSPFGDKTFIFITKSLPSLKDAFMFMIKQYSLSKPLNMPQPMKLRRLKTVLKEFRVDKIYNIALDLDEITTKEDYEGVYEYFADNNYSVILGKSRNWNGKTNLNLKGILRVNLTNEENIIKSALGQIQLALGDKCKVDLSAGNEVSLQAPTNSSEIILYNEKGKVISDADVYIDEVKSTLDARILETQKLISYNNDVVDECIRIFNNLGYTPISGINDNGSINFQHPSERKSKGGYFWYSSNPLIMHHNNKDKTINCFYSLKETEIGKDWLKSKTKEEQEQQLIKPTNAQGYKKFSYVNERYLDFSIDDKSKMLDEFLADKSGVFKLKSAMGSAKSSGIDLCIKKVHERGETVILVSNRVTVAKDFADKYNIMLYKHPDAWKHDGSMIVQYDSLHKFNLTKYDVVIFDEFTSLLLHHRAGLTDNANINAVKFKILLEKKRVLIADAFLTGYEDIFFKERNIYAIMNEYKDNIDLFEYKNKEFFVNSIIDRASGLKDGEHISASFTSLNIMKVVEMKLLEKGIKVVILSSETSELTRDIIFRRFKEKSHNAFQVILFTPTLTVGVSNLNNIPYHFHYDSGMSTDVISSLQMIKRSRTTKEIHYFLEERQFYFDTDIDSINSIAEKNINSFYTNKDKTLLIDVDMETGELGLTELAKYINEIEVFYNVLANNHANAFRLLLQYQFESNAEIIETEDNSYTVRSLIKEINNEAKNKTLEILNAYSTEDWNMQALDEIRTKTATLEPDEKAKVIMGDIQERFKTSFKPEILKELALKEIDSDYKFVSKIKNMGIIMKSSTDNDYTRYLLSKSISSDISSLQNKAHIQFLEYLLIMRDKIKLKNSYSRNEIKKIDEDVQKGKRFEKFLKRAGYTWGEARLKIDPDVMNYIKYV